MTNRITPDKITALKPYECFVFGSNLAGRHGAGAAKTAMRWGARYGRGKGHYGQTFAIATLDERLRKRPLADIEQDVHEFIKHAEYAMPEITFLVSEIGCGLAGFTVEEIAPIFAEAIHVPNIHLPARFWAVLNP